MGKTEQESVNKFSVLKSCFELRILLERKWKEAGFTLVEISEDSEKFGRVGISKTTLSGYLKSFDLKTGEYVHSARTKITEENLLWLCKRWGVTVSFKVSPRILTQEALIKEASNFNPKDIYK